MRFSTDALHVIVLTISLMFAEKVLIVYLICILVSDK